MIIVGITGTLGAGKGTVVNYLVKKRGFKHLSVREYLSNEIKKSGLEVNRNSLINKGNELRSKFGSSFLAEELYVLAKKSGKDCVIESLRTPGEINALRKKGKFYLFAVDADPKVRYERITKRAGETDRVTFKEFMSHEQKEMTSEDPNKQNLQKCILMSDCKFDNNGTVKELYEKVEKVISKI